MSLLTYCPRQHFLHLARDRYIMAMCWRQARNDRYAEFDLGEMRRYLELAHKLPESHSNLPH
jgi:hypothetical protein